MRLFIPLLDSVIQQLEDRFNDLSSTAVKVLALHPQRMIDVDSVNTELSDTIKFYESDLPDKDLVMSELRIYQQILKRNPSPPMNLNESLLQIDECIFPNVTTLLKIAKTLPVTSCESERSFSSLRRIRTWLRSNMSSSRLSNLARIHAHRGRASLISKDRIMTEFLKMSPRALEFDICLGQNLLSFSILVFFFLRGLYVPNNKTKGMKEKREREKKLGKGNEKNEKGREQKKLKV